MTPAERIYRALMWLYPVEHRRAFGAAMVQHARDMHRDAQPHGPWRVAALGLYLIGDGLVNALVEHWEVIMTAKKRFQPAPWWSVLLAALPGLLLALGRLNVGAPGLNFSILGRACVVVLVVAVPVVWWRSGRFPIWALLPAGLLAWHLTYFLGVLGGQALFQRLSGSGWMGLIVVQAALALVLWALLLRSQRLPLAVWGLLAFMVLLNGLGGLVYRHGLGAARASTDLARFMMQAMSGPAEGLFLVALGALAARRHGVAALLVVVGGYGYMLMDSDYLFGYPLQGWTGITPYLVAMTLWYLVLAPAACLRATTGRIRALALLGPAVLFHLVRLTLPLLALPNPPAIRIGDIGLSLNVLLSLILAWLLYRSLAEVPRQAQMRVVEANHLETAG